MKKEVDIFIQEHTHINYCEAIIHPSGEVEYAAPSHTECLMRIYGKPRDVINNEMPITESPLDWLSIKTECIPVWTIGYYLPKDLKVTANQKYSLNALIKAKLVKKSNFCMFKYNRKDSEVTL